MRFLAPADLRGLGARALDDMLGRSELTVAMADGDVRGTAAAALLFADFAVLNRNATLHLDSNAVWAAVAWRLGRRALQLVATESLSAHEAKTRGLCDDVTGESAQVWRERWMQHRSVLALDSAAMLIRRRGGDVLERAEFARLFALGEPQKGLGAFLAKAVPRFLGSSGSSEE
jgi:enoyl-CoA hydratase/carnithine racemase